MAKSKDSKLKNAAVKVGTAIGKAHGTALAAGKRVKKKAQEVGKELKESKKHLVRAYEKAKS